MEGHGRHLHGPGMHAMSEMSVRLIQEAATVEILLFSPDGDPLAMVEVSKAEAVRLVNLPPCMGHVFRAAREARGIVFVEPVEPVD